MSLNSPRTIDELELECLERGIETYGFATKTDFIKAIQHYEISNGNYDKTLSYMLDIDSPMLCAQFTKLNKTMQDIILSSPDYCVQEKIDGCRMLLMFTRVDGELKFGAYSRNKSVKTFLPINYAEKILLNKFDNTQITCDFVVDCEVVCTKSDVQCTKKSAKTGTQLQSTTAILSSDVPVALAAQVDAPLKFIVFDCLSHNDVNLTNLPLSRRQSFMYDAYNQLYAAGLNIELVRTRCVFRPGQARESKLEFYQHIVDTGGEGVVFKDLTKPYVIDGTRKPYWVKMKRSLDTIDCFVTSFDWGTDGKSRSNEVASLTCSVYLRTKDDPGTLYRHEICAVCNFTEQERQEMTYINAVGCAMLKQEYYGRVMEVTGQDISARNKRIMHAKFVKWRPDRDKQSCVIETEFLTDNVL